MKKNWKILLLMILFIMVNVSCTQAKDLKLNFTNCLINDEYYYLRDDLYSQGPFFYDEKTILLRDSEGDIYIYEIDLNQHESEKLISSKRKLIKKGELLKFKNNLYIKDSSDRLFLYKRDIVSDMKKQGLSRSYGEDRFIEIQDDLLVTENIFYSLKQGFYKSENGEKKNLFDFSTDMESLLKMPQVSSDGAKIFFNRKREMSILMGDLYSYNTVTNQVLVLKEYTFDFSIFDDKILIYAVGGNYTNLTRKHFVSDFYLIEFNGTEISNSDKWTSQTGEEYTFRVYDQCKNYLVLAGAYAEETSGDKVIKGYHGVMLFEISP